MIATTPSTEAVLERFKALRAASAAVPSKTRAARGERAAWLEIATVLHVFDLAALRLPGAAKSDAAAWLIDETISALGQPTAGLRTLQLDARREGLGRFADRAAMRAALDLSPARRLTDVQRLFEAWVDSGELPLNRMTARELHTALTLCDWGIAERDDFPDAALVAAAARRRDLVGGFDALAAGFVGRATELAELHAFIGFAPGSLLEQLRERLVGRRSAPMVVHGVGGAGKTALVARFILDYFERAATGRFPFVYLAFDDRALRPDEPATIIAAVLRQLDAQIEAMMADRRPDAFAVQVFDFERIVKARDATRAELESYYTGRAALSGRATSDQSQAARTTRLGDSDRSLFESFAQLLASLTQASAGATGKVEIPLLFVLDSFEEVEYLPESDLHLFWKLVGTLSSSVPALRLLIVGRVPPVSAALAKHKPRALALGDLTPADAAELLHSHGVGDAAAAVIAQIGCNPLTLRLAARVLADPDGDGLTGLRTKRFGLFTVGQEVIRGQLYRRVLDHIHDPDVRALAHPGMVLRRVTPDLIARVLAPASGLGHIDAARSVALFEALSRELALVRGDGTGALLYRDEVRRPMLRALAADKPEQTEALHRAATDYYYGAEDDTGRAEEIYHHLMLPDPPFAYLETRWRRGVQPRIAEALDELPPASKPWLASVMRLRLTGDEARYASVAETERIVGREALQAIRLNDFARAATLLEGVETAPDGPLVALRARALAGNGQAAAASAYLGAAIAAFPLLGNQARLAELLWLAAQTDGDAVAAVAWLDRLLPVATSLDSRLALVQALTELIGRADAPRLPQLRARLAAALRALSSAEVDTERSLVRLALSRLGPRERDLWKRLAPGLADDLAYEIAERPEASLAALRERLGDALRPAQPSDPLAWLAERLEDAGLDAKSIHDIKGALIGGVLSDSPDAVALSAIWVFFSTEGTSLAAATLAGLERDRLYDGSAMEASA